jgi:hypothetical protein
MRFAKTAGGLGFVFDGRRNFFGRCYSCLDSRFCRGRNVRSGGRFACRSGGTCNATAAAASPASAATLAGATRWIQIGFFVRHKLSREDGGLSGKSNCEFAITSSQTA